MNILVTGATGFIGAALVSRLMEGGHHVAALRRTRGHSAPVPSWNPDAKQVHLDPAVSFDAVIHLAGENIAQRWTPAAKARIRGSRAGGTSVLCEALARLPRPPRTLICASAVGFYGDRADEVLDEQSGPGSGFLAETCCAWEAAADSVRQNGTRVVCLRLGMVLSPNGGAVAGMLPIFRLGLGGRVGSGRQYWSWIALEDLLGVVELALLHDRLNGAVNAVAPESATNSRFAASLARALRRPALLPVPAFLIKAIFGDMGREVLLASARVRPARLSEAGFKFRWPDIDAAFSHLLGADRHSQPK